MDEKSGNVDKGKHPEQTIHSQAASALSPDLVSPVSPVSSTSPTAEAERPREPSDFVEHQQCPPPEVAVQQDEQPEPLSNLDELAADRQNANDKGLSAGSRRHVRRIVDGIQPDFGDERPPAQGLAGPSSKRSWLARHKLYVIIGVALAVSIIIVASAVGALIKTPRKAAGGSAPQSR